jgi:hypothetical protein
MRRDSGRVSVNFVANPLYKRGDLLIDWIP